MTSRWAPLRYNSSSSTYELSIRSGIRLSPRDFRLSFWGMLLADALMRVDRLDEALAQASLVSRCDNRLYGARVVASWAMVRLNRLDEARQALSEARRIRPHPA